MSKLLLLSIAGAFVAALIAFFPSLRRGFTELTPFGFQSETVVVTGDSNGGEQVPRELEIVTLLGFDAIPAITDPSFVSAGQAAAWMDPDEQVVGLEINGERRAYPVTMLSRHEIVNDDVGGVPVVVTW